MTKEFESQRARRDKVRNLKDRFFGLSMSIGGVSVIGAILLIFFYLMYVVLPLIFEASIEKGFSIDGPREEGSLLIDIDEYNLLTNSEPYLEPHFIHIIVCKV